ncbi:hypothetical protein SDC9_208640 [bioreactor metagenome]|uniref:Uncharacterized protein n=1 Tax=bioreactor metagenome TaxID=1076179 RepID=A0A645JC46_9ZZZZ
MDRIDPGAIGIVPVGAGLNQGYFTQQSLLYNLTSTLIGFNLSVLMPQLKNEMRIFLNERTECIGLRNSPCHRFLHIYMLPCPDGIHGHGTMPMIGSRNHHRIHIGCGQQLTVMQITLWLRTILTVQPFTKGI